VFEEYKTRTPQETAANEPEVPEFHQIPRVSNPEEPQLENIPDEPESAAVFENYEMFPMEP
jgi:hypothetical protein